MSSARKRYVTLLFAMACLGLAVSGWAAEETRSNLANAMPGVIAGSATTAPSPDLTAAVGSTTAVRSTSAYAPPNAAQLIQLLAPVAVFPDSLVAEVLAAATYPDQVLAVDAWLAQNGKLTGAPLQSALAQQNWDDGVKALAQFPEVLHQMATNPQWTTALGEAYVNDPVDVMNAVQALRKKAIANGNLKSSQYLTVTSAPNEMARLPADASPDPDEPPVYEGSALVPPPEQIVEIAPADPDDVYVPYYDPGVFYGPQFGVWPGYAYAWPAPVYYGSAFGAFAFGAGVAIDIGFGHSWGWHSWHTRWGPGYYGHGWRGPSVVHDNHPYADHSDRIVNHFAPHESGGYRRAERPARNIEGLANSPAGSAENRANAPARGGIDPSPEPGAGFAGNRIAPMNVGQMSMPHFNGAMAQRGNAVGVNAAAHEAALASGRYAPPRNAAGMRDPAASAHTYRRDAGVTRRDSPPSYRGDPGFVRGTPMESRVLAQRPRPPQQNITPGPVRGGAFQGRENEPGGRPAPSRAATGGNGGGHAGGTGRH